MKILTVGNTKGGVGKSTIATNLAVEAALNGKKILMIDGDAQASSLSFRATRVKDDIKAIAITTATIHMDIKDFTKLYDLIIIDIGGRDTAVFRSAMMACDMMLIPILPSQYDIWAAGDTVEILREARAFKKISACFVMNQVIPNTIVSKEANKAIYDFKEDVQLLKSVLHSRVAFKKSVPSGMGVSECNKVDDKSTIEIKNLYKEVFEYEI